MFIYRFAYVINADEPANIHFSAWVREDGLDGLQAELESVNPPDGDSPGGTLPIIIGLDRLKMFDRDSLDEEE